MAPITTDAPDWSLAATAELTCPLCNYNLRGLTEPRCPECGFAFQWAELLDAKRDRHRYLFEHGQRRNVRTFLGTYFRTCLPRRFWRQVTPANPVHLGRLLVYWLIVSLPLVAIVAAPVPGQVVVLANRNMRERTFFAQQMSQELAQLPPGTDPKLLAAEVSQFQAQVDARFPAPWSVAFAEQAYAKTELVAGRDGLAAGAVVLAWPWLSAVALLVFQVSMRRAKVSIGHVLRAAIYGCDFGFLMCVAAAVVFSPMEPANYSIYYYRSGRHTLGSQLWSGPFPPRDMPLLLVVVGCAAVATYRLSLAYGRYLRFDRPLLSVLAAQAIVVLTVVIALLWTVRLF